VSRARWLGLSEVLIDETLFIHIWSIRFEPKRRAGSESLRLAVATGGWRNSSSQPGVTGEPVAPKASLFTAFIARDAKLFTIDCGESFQRLSSPLVNNFGKAIRLEALPGVSGECPASLPRLSGPMVGRW
jgi:hypothetical protein